MCEESEKESALVRNPLLRIIIFEAIGTLILVYGILCSQYLPPLSEKVSNPFHDVFISLSLYLSIVICGPLSGGHFNMAVTTGVCNVKNSSMTKKRYWAFVVGQFIGAIISAVLGKVLWDCEGAPFDSNIGWLQVIGVGIGEMIGTFMFIFVILLVTTPETTFVSEDSWAHFLIPLGLFLSRRMSPKLGGINPTVIIVLQISGIIIHGTNAMTLLQIFVISLFSLSGAHFASKLFSQYQNNLVKWQSRQ